MWYAITRKTDGRQLYARRGFGADGQLVAVYDFDRCPMSTGVRLTPEACRSIYQVVGKAANSDEIESRFGWELNR